MTDDEFSKEVEDIIESAPEEYRERLRGLQWKCDMIRKGYGNNRTGAMMAISQLMIESLRDLNIKINELLEELKK